jgi:fructose-specific phosphotransferase system component IIB
LDVTVETGGQVDIRNELDVTVETGGQVDIRSELDVCDIQLTSNIYLSTCFNSHTHPTHF